jgi:flagellar hook-associated protein 1 FlgK
MVKTNAEVLTGVFHNVAGELRDLRQTRNDEIGTRVERVNQILHEMYNLNREIAAVETNNQKANDSRDRRDLLLKELSELIDIETRENDLGQITVTTRGNILVSPVDVQELELTTSSFRQADGTTRTDIGIRFSNSKRDYMPSSGQIRGLIDSRDTIIPNYVDQVDHLAISLVETINGVHQNGYSLDGYSGLNFFDPDLTGAADIALAPAITSNVQNIAAAQGGERREATENISHTYGNAPVDLLHRDLQAQTVTVTNQGSGVVLTEGVDYHVDYARGTFQLLNATHDGAALSIEYQYSTGGFRGAGDNANAIAISELRHQLTMVPNAVGANTATFTQYYASFIGSLGLARTEAGSNLETRQFLVDQYETHQDSIAGVSLDEEMAEMIKFQHSYQAAARIISTASQMLEVLMNM